MSEIVEINSYAVEAEPEFYAHVAEPPESPVNITTADLEWLNNRITQLRWPDIEAAVEQRRDGAPQRLLTALLTQGRTLTQAHAEAGRLESTGEQKLHEMGLILGTIVCNEQHYAHTGRRLQADRPDEFEAAFAMTAENDLEAGTDLYGLFSALSNTYLMKWWHERYRELNMTGNDAFSTLYAITRGHVRNLLETAPTSDWKTAGDVETEDAAAAMLSGLIDARRFFLRYMRNIRKPEMVIGSWHTLEAEGMPVPFDDTAFTVGPDEGVDTVLTKMEFGKPKWDWYDITCGGMMGKMLTHSQIVQMGPSQFQRVHLVFEHQIPDTFPVEKPESSWFGAHWLREHMPDMKAQGLEIRGSQELDITHEQRLARVRDRYAQPIRAISVPVDPLPRQAMTRTMNLLRFAQELEF